MNRLILFFPVLLTVLNSSAQFHVTSSALYSAPLHKFCEDNYSQGWGGKFGLGYTIKKKDQLGLEFGLNWLVNSNGYAKTDLDIGEYILRNNWYNGQFKLNAVWENGLFRYYFGSMCQ